MQTSGSYSNNATPRIEWHPVESYCAGFREDAGNIYGKDSISIHGMEQQSTQKNPQFLAILEERVVSFLA
jgi:hypothetical protein